MYYAANSTVGNFDYVAVGVDHVDQKRDSIMVAPITIRPRCTNEKI